MSEVVHLSVLVCLLTATLCSGSNVSSTTEQNKPTIASTLSTAKTSNSTTPQLQTTGHWVTTEAASTPPGTLGTAETSPSPGPLTTLTTATVNDTVSQEQTASPGTANATTNTIVHTTNQVSLPIQTKDNLAANPGLIAVICIFCIVLALTLVVLTVKCIQSPRSNFERLEDVPLGKVNEESAFAHYSK